MFKLEVVVFANALDYM